MCARDISMFVRPAPQGSYAGRCDHDQSVAIRASGSPQIDAATPLAPRRRTHAGMTAPAAPAGASGTSADSVVGQLRNAEIPSENARWTDVSHMPQAAQKAAGSL